MKVKSDHRKPGKKRGVRDSNNDHSSLSSTTAVQI